MRPSQRQAGELRQLCFTRRFTVHAEGSVLVEMGGTRVLCTASVEDSVPGFLRGKGQGWVTAEYGMLPRATHTRGGREAARGKQTGRTQEIQRLIGRSLRAVTDLKALAERQITLDCDVLQADGGTRCASITGAWLALAEACNGLVASGQLSASPLRDHVAAISVGIYRGEPGSYHSGLDIATGGTGDPFVAPADGVVVLATDRPFSLEGNLLIIDHGQGLNSAFLHLSEIAVAQGAVVRQGQYLGRIGSTGRATGPHLHWGLKWRDTRLDPLLFVGPMP